MTDAMADAFRRTLIEQSETNPWVRDIPRLFGRDRIEDLTDAEVLDAARELNQAGRRKQARNDPIGADFKAKMQSMGCGCPVLYDNDSHGQRIQSSARVDHLRTCGLKTVQEQAVRVELDQVLPPSRQQERRSQ